MVSQDDENDDIELWLKVAKNFIKAGVFKNPLTDTLIELLKNLISEEQAKFLLIFDNPELNINQIKERTELDDISLEKMLKSLMKDGIIMGTKEDGVILGLFSKLTGIMIYRLLPLYPGIFEMAFMKGETGEKERKLALLFDKIFEEMVPGVQGSQRKYDRTVKFYKNLPAFDRVIPVEEEIEAPPEKILPVEEVKILIEKHDIIGIARCYCRHEKDLINKPCKLTDSRDNCMYFGKFAQYLIDYEFAKPISKEEARKILKESEESGLVHKTIHFNLNPKWDEIAICSCCKCCCGIFDVYYRGVVPLHSITSYLSKVDKDICAGCGTCVERCPTEAIELIDDIAIINEAKCIGCGICAHFCPEEAISLERTGPRKVFIPPPKIASILSSTT